MNLPSFMGHFSTYIAIAMGPCMHVATGLRMTYIHPGWDVHVYVCMVGNMHIHIEKKTDKIQKIEVNASELQRKNNH